jgi:hypothetical protein
MKNTKLTIGQCTGRFMRSTGPRWPLAQIDLAVDPASSHKYAVPVHLVNARFCRIPRIHQPG